MSEPNSIHSIKIDQSARRKGIDKTKYIVFFENDAVYGLVDLPYDDEYISKWWGPGEWGSGCCDIWYFEADQTATELLAHKLEYLTNDEILSDELSLDRKVLFPDTVNQT